MTASGVNGKGSLARAGTRALLLLATPLSGAILRQLDDGPKRLVDLRRANGSPAPTTLRAHLKELEEAGAVAKRRGSSFPGVVECELTSTGRELAGVADALEDWLQRSPNGSLTFGSREAKVAIKALVDGWASNMLRALAARPLSLTELDGLIAGLSYPSLERRLGAMKLAGQLEPCWSEGDYKGKPYAATEWLRQGVAPLVSAAIWERRHLAGETLPFGRIDAEAVFLLALPLLRLPSELSGSCRLGIEMNNGEGRRLVGAMAYVEEGRIASCNVRLDKNADAWATGSTTAWLHALTGADVDGLELGGDQRLARTLLEGLHRSLFGAESLRAR